MADVPNSPHAARVRAPGWLDPRLLLGVLLVLASVVGGSRVFASADQSQQVWVVTHDLAPGSVLSEGDLRPGRARLFDLAGRYVSGVGAKPSGYVLRRGLGAGELLPTGAVVQPGLDVTYRSVSVPVPRGHLPPDLAVGEQVDVYVTPDDRNHSTPAVGASPAPTVVGPHLVLDAVTVLFRPAEGDLAGSGSAEVPVVLQVRPVDVLPLVTALSQGRIDLVRVPRGDERTPSLAPGSGGH